MAVPLTTIFSWFEKGDFPTEYQFKQTFSSFRHADERIRMDEVSGLQETVQNIVSANVFNDHLEDENAHISVLAKLNASNLSATDINNWKEKLQINAAATIDGDHNTGNVYTKAQTEQILNILRAKDDALLQSIDEIGELLASDDVNLDKLQEIVHYIKENRRQIELMSDIIAEGSSDDTINLVGSYSHWGAITYQSQFNNLVYEKIRQIEDTGLEKIRHEEKVRSDSRIKHDLNTLSFAIDAYDIVTMFSIPLKVRRIDTNTIDVLFDSVPPNMIQLTIKKL
ncbi:hypothetical protein EG349_19435 [Chryseobacterium shandongense]|jgi:hypothetical protein|uniref:Uncharacterized protein n=1 Tax=Chryseobacterium shandongense TaxID=1493872 RepID=A0A3G6Q7S9_9FLAO|nr:MULTISPECIES: hypothetical protein [Chryseobacterium]AZA57078.1 hypothetical protein EG350_07755 [Chryseobacterium shandongense]AZA88790.1 hypothetical protein EG349_19435 [Chryseobacterium shandongense]AZA97334.1 hypothetical protein EG353_18155 [Chryseobacterium shandongense]